jgi:hypothetical protein
MPHANRAQVVEGCNKIIRAHYRPPKYTTHQNRFHATLKPKKVV